MKTPFFGGQLRSYAGIKILPALIGLNVGSRQKLEAALQAPSIFNVIMILIGLRFRRLIGKLLAPLARGAPPSLGGNDQISVDLGSDKVVSADVGACAGIGPVQRSWRPQVSHDGAFPRLIFQTWKSKISLPYNYAHWSGSLRRLNPDFDYILWDDADNRKFINEYYPWFLPFYDAYPREIYRADAVRYFFLYQYGGLYVDMDTECLKPLSPLFYSGDVWLGRMGGDPAFPHSIPNAIMASRPRQEFWLLAIHFLVENASACVDANAAANRSPEAMTGPILLKRAYDTYVSSQRRDVQEMIQDIAARLPDGLRPHGEPSKVVLLAPDLWYPIDWSNIIHFHLLSEITSAQLLLGESVKRRLFPNSFLATYWTHSWKVPASRSPRRSQVAS